MGEAAGHEPVQPPHRSLLYRTVLPSHIQIHGTPPPTDILEDRVMPSHPVVEAPGRGPAPGPPGRHAGPEGGALLAKLQQSASDVVPHSAQTAPGPAPRSAPRPAPRPVGGGREGLRPQSGNLHHGEGGAMSS